MRIPHLLLGFGLALSACDGGNDQLQPGETVTVDRPRSAANAPGVTPMADRVAIIGLLNKRNGIVQDLRLKPGQAVRIKDVIVRLRACETAAPWEPERLTGAFLQVDVQRPDQNWNRVFSGWVYKESPSLNVVEHPVYDVWPKSCTMSWPSAPGMPAGPASTSRRSSAANSGGGQSGRAEPTADETTGEDEPAPPVAPPPVAPSVPSAPESNST